MRHLGLHLNVKPVQDDVAEHLQYMDLNVEDELHVVIDLRHFVSRAARLRKSVCRLLIEWQF